MEKQTGIAQTIDLAADRARYDECAKRLLAYKAIDAWILKTCTKEFSGYSIKFICDHCLKDDAEVSQHAVHQDQLNRNERLDGDKKLELMNAESSSIREQTIYYDIRFRAFLPGETEPMQLIVNLEVQANDTPGYPLVMRGLYYCARMLSEQYGTVFTTEHYEKIQKVYSIWICPDPANKRKNGIFRYHTVEETVLGQPYVRPEEYDLMEVVILNLGDARKRNQLEILDLLNTLFSSGLTPEEKKERLNTRFGIEMTTEFESEVQDMCDLSRTLVDEGEKRIAALMKILLEQNRIEDAKRASEDKEFRDRLMKELKIIQ